MAIKLNEIYKCSVCGNVVEVVEPQFGTLVCCGQDMELMKEKTAAEEGKEKHVPVIEIKGNTAKVSVGSTLHPMEEGHYIEFIEVLKGGIILAKKQLKPGEKPIAEFCLEDTKGLAAREYCNIHGLWKT